MHWNGVGMDPLSLSSRKGRAHPLIGSSPLQAHSPPNTPSPFLTPSYLSPSNCCALVTRPRAFLWFHHRLWWETEPPPHKSERKWGKNSNKIHADLQIEKVREREEEDSPLTKPCAHKIQHHPSNERQKKKKTQTGENHLERELIALLLYLLGFEANAFHIATRNPLDAPKKMGEKSDKNSMGLWSCDLKNTNKQIVSLKHVARSHESTYLLCLLGGMKSSDNYRQLLPHRGLT